MLYRRSRRNQTKKRDKTEQTLRDVTPEKGPRSPFNIKTLDEMRVAQGEDKDISVFRDLLVAHPRAKPSAKSLSAYSSTVKSLWTKWGEMKIENEVLYQRKKADPLAPL